MSVPATISKTPNSPSANSGDHSAKEKNSVSGTSWKNEIVGPTREKTMPTVTATDTAAHTARRPMMTFSP